jgi:hypothetical protein
MRDARAERRHDGVYASIRAMIVRHELPAHHHIRVETLADGLRVSNTPVREALIRLAAERLIEEIPNAGFFTKPLDEGELRELLRLLGALIDWCLSLARPENGVPGPSKPPRLFELATALPAAGALELADALYLHIPSQWGGRDAVRMVDNLAARTFYLRLTDAKHVSEVAGTIAHLCRLYGALDIAALRLALADFHRAQIARLSDIVRLIEQADGGNGGVRSRDRI